MQSARITHLNIRVTQAFSTFTHMDYYNHFFCNKMVFAI